MPRLDSVEEVADFESLTFFFFDAYEGVAHSLELFFDAILITCEEYEYRSPIIDAIVIRVLPREVVQAGMVPKTLASRSLVRDVGKELPQVEPVVFMSFRVD